MHVSLWLAPAAGGKTAAVVDLLRSAAAGLASTPRVVVPSHLQVRALRRRLALAGGALNVRLLTFDRLYAECLNAAGEAYTELSEPVLYRLIRSQLDHLTYYAPLVNLPGFTSSLQSLFAEFKAALITPEDLTAAVAALGNDARLAELALIYSRYQQQLHAQSSADRIGLGWLALEVLRATPDLGRDWPLLAIDGFDSFTPLELALLAELAGRVDRMIITLTGSVEDPARPLVWRRFQRTRAELESALGIPAESLPHPLPPIAPDLRALEAGLFPPTAPEPASEPAPEPSSEPAIELIEAPDRAGEVRAALRWLKARLLGDHLPLHSVALLAREIAPYRPFIQQTAAEFELPVRLVEGLPLKSSPVIAALLDLLRLMLPAEAETSLAAGPANAGRLSDATSPPEYALPYRLVVEAWRSPYFDWSALPAEDSTEPIGIGPGDADRLAAIARWGQVVGGEAQWREALDRAAARSATLGDGNDNDHTPPDLPSPEQALLLRGRFERFVDRLRPPAATGATLLSYRTLVAWLEDLIGADPDPGSAPFPAPPEPTSLQVVTCAKEGPPPGCHLDVAALRALKDILRGLVWAEEAFEGSPGQVDYARFFEELSGVIESEVYLPPVDPGRDELLVAGVRSARGLPLAAAAILGLAEGEFPKTQHEDPFLRESDRTALAGWQCQPEQDRTALRACGLHLESSIDSAEVQAFYEAVTRPSHRLLLTRPRLAENGAPWEASPLWEEVRRVTRIAPLTLTSDARLKPKEVASWPELMELLAVLDPPAAQLAWALAADAPRLEHLRLAAALHDQRSGRGPASDGDLSSLSSELGQTFGPAHVWSPSRLEVYRCCPFHFFIANLLGLEPRPEPTVGPEPTQLGTIYHQILEKLYRRVANPRDLAQLQEALPAVAREVLDAAPRELGFRQTQWWERTREEIQVNTLRTLEELDREKGQWRPVLFEAAFGRHGSPPLVIDGDPPLLLHGIIDRIDLLPEQEEARRLRIIDYKSGGAGTYTAPSVEKGKKLQLPLYALAARDAIDREKRGQPIEGFYWHILDAKRSGFSLSKFKSEQFGNGPQGAIAAAVTAATAAVWGVRAGAFAPSVPDGGCPSYCAATGICWLYDPRFEG